MKTWCCDKLKQNITLTIDSQDINDIYNGFCPYCKKLAKIGKRSPKPKKLTHADMFDNLY